MYTTWRKEIAMQIIVCKALNSIPSTTRKNKTNQTRKAKENHQVSRK
jgi:hypothetical protein